jgi:hypothetical protein
VGGKGEEVRGMILLYLVPHMKGIGDSNEGYKFGMRELLHNLVVRYVALSLLLHTQVNHMQVEAKRE